MNQFFLRRTKGSPVTDDELTDDLIAVSKKTEKKFVTQSDYKKFGSFEYSTVIRRFGKWNEALRTAGLEIANNKNYTREELFENLLKLWQHNGHQPRRIDLTSEISTISQSPYNRVFGSWTNSLREFVNYMNEEADEIFLNTSRAKGQSKRRTGRDPSLRVRYKVLRRDNFKCVICGASPANDTGVELHIDHIIPWSKGGETVLENLQSLCSRCNLGKSDME